MSKLIICEHFLSAISSQNSSDISSQKISIELGCSDPDNSKKLVNITIHDARKRPPGTFHESGFTLIELDKEPVTQDWRTNSKQKEDADILKFFEQMEPHVKKLYPDAKRIE